MTRWLREPLLHFAVLVRIIERGTTKTPSLAEARDVVTREWTRARAVEMREKFYQSLRQRYTVTIEP